MASLTAPLNLKQPDVSAASVAPRPVAANKNAEAQNLQPKNLLKRHILIVEDHESNILVTSLLLKEFGCTYDVAMNGFQAVDLYKDKKYDAVLMDIQMPKMSGLEATTIIRQMERDMDMPHTPIIALTAHVQPANKDQAIAAGMDDFLAKPFDSYDLRSKLERII